MLSLTRIADICCPTAAKPLYERVRRSPIAMKLASGTFWAVFGNAVGKGLTFIAMVFVARILGTQLYGELGLIRSAADIFICLSSFGLGITATKYIAELADNDKQRTGRIIGLSYIFTLITCFLAAVFLFLAAPLICNSPILKAPQLVNELRISIFMLIFMTFTGTQVGVMSGFQDFKGIAYTNFITGLISIPVYVLGSYYGGLSGAIIGMGIAASSNVAVNSVFIYYNTSRHNIRYDFRNSWNELPVVWKMSVPAFLCGVTYCVFTAIYRFMLAASPNGFHELGIYVAASQIELVVYFIPFQISNVLLPLLSNVGRRDNRKANRLSNLGIILNMGIALTIVLPILLMPQYIMSLFGNGFTEGSAVLILICAGLVFHAGLRSLFSEYISQNRMMLFFGLTCIFHLAQLFLLYYFISLNYGAWGMAAAYSLAHIWYFTSVLLFRKRKCYE